MFLQNFALVVFQGGLAAEVLVDDEEHPDCDSVDDQEVDEDGGDVAIPNLSEVGIQGKIAH